MEFGLTGGRMSVYELIKEFLKKHKNGEIHLIYPDGLGHTGGVQITHRTVDNEHKIKFLDDGIMIYQTLGYSLVTGKHLFLPYGNCAFVFIEESD